MIAPAPLTIQDGQINNLVISEDRGDEDEPIAILLFTADMQKKMEHHHIELSLAQARRTYEWLGEFLKKHP